MNGSPELIWIRETPLRSQNHGQNEPFARRSHRKSRRGCKTCKSRRVKCGEEHPVCANCKHRNIECIYPDPSPYCTASRSVYSTPPADQSLPWTSTSDLSSEACLGTHVFATSIARMAGRSAASGKSSTSFVHILQHFETSSYRTLSSPTGQRILHDKIPSMLMSHPFLLHTVLAYSSSHLQYLTHQAPINSNTMTLTATYHTHRALNLYASRINKLKSTPSHLLSSTTGLEEMDALFAACIMLTSLFYHVNEIDLPYPAWTIPSSTRPHQYPAHQCKEAGIDWLTNISGLSILFQLSHFQQQLPHSVWFPFLMESNPSHKDIAPTQWNSDLRADNLQRRLEIGFDPSSVVPELVELILSSPQPTYSATLAVLTPLLEMDPTDLRNFSSFISFPSKLSREFVGMIRTRPPDAIALLILGYWFSRMSKVPHWWCRARGEGEAVAIAWYVDGIVQDADNNSKVRHRWSLECKVGSVELLRKALVEFKQRTGVQADMMCEMSARKREELMWSHFQIVGNEWSRDGMVVQGGQLSGVRDVVMGGS